MTFGEFDGIHRGHQAVIRKLTEIADKRQLKSVLVSMPKQGNVFTTEEEKEYLLKDFKVDYFVTHTEKTEDFVEKTVVKELNAKVIIVGAGFKDLENLEKTAEKYNIELVVVDMVKEDNENISKQMLEKAYQDCDYEQMTKLLGYPYIMLGKVVHGKALGRTVGMPTANLQVPDHKYKPLSGVYCTRVLLEDEVFKAMTNIGKRPSVDNYDYVTIEAFILDFSRDIYGKQLVLEVHKFVRGVVKFDNLEQVQKDIEEVRSLLEKIG